MDDLLGAGDVSAGQELLFGGYEIHVGYVDVGDVQELPQSVLVDIWCPCLGRRRRGRRTPCRLVGGGDAPQHSSEIGILLLFGGKFGL